MKAEGPVYPPAPAGNAPSPVAVRGEDLVLPDIEWAIENCPIFDAFPYGDYTLHRYPQGGLHWSKPEFCPGVHDGDWSDAETCAHFDVVALIEISPMEDTPLVVAVQQHELSPQARFRETEPMEVTA